jgi:hypothetical protein
MTRHKGFRRQEKTAVDIRRMYENRRTDNSFGNGSGVVCRMQQFRDCASGQRINKGRSRRE